MILYFDTSAWCRPHDDFFDVKEYDEAVAIMDIIERAIKQKRTILGSVTNVKEFAKMKDPIKHRRVMNRYYDAVSKPASYNSAIFSTLYGQARAANVGERDSYHLCYAESSGADYLITVDDEFVDRAKRVSTQVEVIHPLTFMQRGII